MGPTCLMDKLGRCAGQQNLKHDIFVVWLPVHDGISCMELGKGHSLGFTEGSDTAILGLVFCQQIGFCFFPCLQVETVPESWNHNALAFSEEHKQKQNLGKGFRLSSGRCQGYKKRDADIYSWAIVKLNNAMALL